MSSLQSNGMVSIRIFLSILAYQIMFLSFAWEEPDAILDPSVTVKVMPPLILQSNLVMIECCVASFSLECFRRCWVFIRRPRQWQLRSKRRASPFVWKLSGSLVVANEPDWRGLCAKLVYSLNMTHSVAVASQATAVSVAGHCRQHRRAILPSSMAPLLKSWLGW